MANGNLDLTRGDSRLQGKLQDGALDGPVRIQEAGRPQDAEGKPISRLRWWWRRWQESGEA